MFSLSLFGDQPAGVQSARLPRVPTFPRISRKPVFWLILLPILAVQKSWADSLPDFSALVEQEGDAVVKISVETESTVPASSGIPGVDPELFDEYSRRFFEQFPQFRQPEQRRGAGFGSGFIISEDGYVITNAHVVNDAVDIRVGLADRREFDAELVGSDTATDIALLKLDAENLPVVKLGDSDELKVGEWVLAIGSPFGFEHTATQGIVSALARSLPDDTYVPFIQTDVAVNPGNSGGPLFNTDGEVIGVNSQIFSRSGGYQGLSFAIPINVAAAIAEQIRDKGYATRGWLGVMIQNVDQALAESFGLERPEGALVAQVTGDSPADKAGFEPGDIILEFNGREVTSSNALPPLVGAVTPGTEVPVNVLREGRTRTLDVTIEALEKPAGGSKLASSSDSSGPGNERRLGVSVAELPADKARELDIEGGVLVTDVDPRGPAAEAGVRPGDIIASVNRVEIASVKQLGTVLSDVPDGKSVPMLIHREDQPIFLALMLDD